MTLTEYNTVEAEAEVVAAAAAEAAAEEAAAEEVGVAVVAGVS